MIVSLFIVVFSSFENARADWPTSPYTPIVDYEEPMYVDPITSRFVQVYDSSLTHGDYYFVNAISPQGTNVFPGHGISIGRMNVWYYPYSSDYPIVPDGFGGCIYSGAGTEYDSTYSTNVAVIRYWRIDSTGQQLWGVDGIKGGYYLNEPELFSQPKFQSDGHGGVFVLTPHPPLTNTHLWLQHFDATGQPLFTNGGIQINEVNTSLGDYARLTYALNRAGSSTLWVTWRIRDTTWTLPFDTSLVRRRVSSVRINDTSYVSIGFAYSNGNAMFQSNYFLRWFNLNGDSLMVRAPYVVNWNTGGYKETIDGGIVYDHPLREATTGRYRWHVGKLDANGDTVFFHTPLTDTDSITWLAPIDVNGSVYYLAVYEYNYGTRVEYYLQKLNGNGIPQWTGRGHVVALSAHGDAALRIFSTPACGIICHWWGESNSYAQALDTNGNIGQGFYTSIGQHDSPSRLHSNIHFHLSDNHLYLSNDQDHFRNIKVFNVLGQQVLHWSSEGASPPSRQIMLSLPAGLAAGRYFLVVRNNSGRIETLSVPVIH